MSQNTFQSALAQRLTDYIALKRGLGLKFIVQADILKAFDRYLHRRGHSISLDLNVILDFVASGDVPSENEQGRRYQVVRHFADYLAIYEPSIPPLPPHLMPLKKERPTPYIYSEKELKALLTAARKVSRRHAERGITLHAIVGLAAATGLRISEVVRLDRGDADLESGILMIRRTKFAKDHLVPLHPSTTEVLRQYAAMRDQAHPQSTEPSFFLNLWGRRFARNTLERAFWNLARHVGLREEKGNGPRFHDLRHTFATRRLIVWYETNADVQAMLPHLATYLGHAHYSDTAWYLSAVPQLMALASRRHQEFLAAKGEGQ
jgi:integrase